MFLKFPASSTNPIPVSCATLKSGSNGLRSNCSPATPYIFTSGSRRWSASTNCAPWASPEASPTTNMICFAITQNRTSELCADHRCDFQGTQSFRAADQRMLASADAFEKRIDLVRESIAFLDLHGLRPNVEPARAGSRFVKNLRPALVIVDRNVGIRLKKTDLPFAFERHAARRDIRNTTVSEFDSSIGDIRPLREHGHSPRFDACRRRPHQTGDHINVMNHQIEYDIDIRAALDERRQTMALDKLGLSYDPFKAANCGVEALEMSDLKQYVFFLGGGDELAGFTDACGERLFHQHIDARIDEIARDL